MFVGLLIVCDLFLVLCLLVSLARGLFCCFCACWCVGCVWVLMLLVVSLLVLVLCVLVCWFCAWRLADCMFFVFQFYVCCGNVCMCFIYALVLWFVVCWLRAFCCCRCVCWLNLFCV